MFTKANLWCIIAHDEAGFSVNRTTQDGVELSIFHTLCLLLWNNTVSIRRHLCQDSDISNFFLKFTLYCVYSNAENVSLTVSGDIVLTIGLGIKRRICIGRCGTQIGFIQLDTHRYQLPVRRQGSISHLNPATSNALPVSRRFCGSSMELINTSVCQQ